VPHLELQLECAESGGSGQIQPVTCQISATGSHQLQPPGTTKLGYADCWGTLGCVSMEYAWGHSLPCSWKSGWGLQPCPHFYQPQFPGPTWRLFHNPWLLSLIFPCQKINKNILLKIKIQVAHLWATTLPLQSASFSVSTELRSSNRGKLEGRLEGSSLSPCPMGMAGMPSTPRAPSFHGNVLLHNVGGPGTG
jgi:hypothetical protein